MLSFPFLPTPLSPPLVEFTVLLCTQLNSTRFEPDIAKHFSRRYSTLNSEFVCSAQTLYVAKLLGNFCRWCTLSARRLADAWVVLQYQILSEGVCYNTVDCPKKYNKCLQRRHTTVNHELGHVLKENVQTIDSELFVVDEETLPK